MTHTAPPDILTFGEAMNLFVADSPGDLSGVRGFQRRIAGADTNVAIGLSRLGHHVGWLSRIGNDSFGRFLRHALEQEGLDCRHLTIDNDHATGLVFKERALEGADPHVEYLRQGSAASHLSPADASEVDFKALRHLHATGIPPALSQSSHDLSRYLLKEARLSGASISFDPNLRPTLWRSEREMRNAINALASQADWILPGLAEGRFLTGRETPYDIAGFYLDQGAEAVFLKLGPEGGYYRGRLEGEEQTFSVPGAPVAEVVDTVGAGDGFAVGVISALLDGLPTRHALQRGCLIGAEAVKVSGDMEGLPHRDTLERLESQLMTDRGNVK